MAWQKLSNIKGDKGDPGPAITTVTLNSGGTLSFTAQDGTVHNTPITPANAVASTLSPISGGKDYGKIGAGTLALDGTVGTHVFDATGAVLVTLPSSAPDFAFFTVTCVSGGANVTWQADAWPLGQPTAADTMTVNYQRVRGQWWGFGTGAGVAATPDTTPPSQPGLVVSAFTDTTVTLAVTRGQDDESTPAFKGRYYVSGAATKPDFASVTLSGTNWQITGLTQNTAYVFEAEEVSKGGASAITSISATTAKTKGWVDSSTANFVAADGTDPATLKMSDGQAIVKDGSGAAAILHNALTLSTDLPGVENGANGFDFPATSTLKMGRVKATYAFKAGSGANTKLRLGFKGVYPLGSIMLTLGGDGTLSLDTGGSNSTWSAPAWTGATTGYPQSGTLSLSLDADGKTVSVWSNGVVIGTTTTTATIPGLYAGRLETNMWGGGGISVSNLEIMTYQS